MYVCILNVIASRASLKSMDCKRIVISSYVFLRVRHVQLGGSSFCNFHRFDVPE